MTTYVLGAGASRHVGYPLTADLARELLVWMKQPRSPERMDYAPAAKRIEENFSSKTDLEALLLEMDLLGRKCKTDTLEEVGIATQLRSDRFLLACALQERFAEIRENPALGYRVCQINLLSRFSSCTEVPIGWPPFTCAWPAMGKPLQDIFLVNGPLFPTETCIISATHVNATYPSRMVCQDSALCSFFPRRQSVSI